MLPSASRSFAVVALSLLVLATGCDSGSEPQARQEVVEDFGALVPADGPAIDVPPVKLQRITTAVPWPRGVEWVDGELIVLARGRHRRAGGADAAVDDKAGTLFRVDPSVYEPVVPGQLASQRVRENATVLAKPTSPPFHFIDGDRPAIDNTLMDRPYCTLIYDEVSRNFFICGYSGVDKSDKSFRKNATDSIHRYDTRNAAWRPVEMHDANKVPADELGYVVSSEHYPHHDPATNPPPHGWLNGADGGCIAGDYLYVVAKDNHQLVQYDLADVRRNPDAPPPASRPVLGPDVTVSHPGGTRRMQAMGPSGAAVHDGYLYVCYRTSSIILRFDLTANGNLAEPNPAELIAVFEPWDKDKQRSANLMDIAFNSRGELFAACATEGRIWKIGAPDPGQPFYGNDQTTRPTTASPYADMEKLTGRPARCGNITFDDRDRLYICSGAKDTDDPVMQGVVYRAVEE